MHCLQTLVTYRQHQGNESVIKGKKHDSQVLERYASYPFNWENTVLCPYANLVYEISLQILIYTVVMLKLVV